MWGQILVSAWSHTSVCCSVAIRPRVVGEEPMVQHGKGVNVHPLVLSEALTHTQHCEEIPWHRPIQLCYRHRLKPIHKHTKTKINNKVGKAWRQTKLKRIRSIWDLDEWVESYERASQTSIRYWKVCTWRDLGPVKNPPEEAPPPWVVLA